MSKDLPFSVKTDTDFNVFLKSAVLTAVECDVPTLSSRGERCRQASQHSLASLHQKCSLKRSLVFRNVCCEASAVTSPEGCTYYLQCW